MSPREPLDAAFGDDVDHDVRDAVEIGEGVRVRARVGVDGQRTLAHRVVVGGIVVAAVVTGVFGGAFGGVVEATAEPVAAGAMVPAPALDVGSSDPP